MPGSNPNSSYARSRNQEAMYWTPYALHYIVYLLQLGVEPERQILPYNSVFAPSNGFTPLMKAQYFETMTLAV